MKYTCNTGTRNQPSEHQRLFSESAAPATRRCCIFPNTFTYTPIHLYIDTSIHIYKYMCHVLIHIAGLVTSHITRYTCTHTYSWSCHKPHHEIRADAFYMIHPSSYTYTSMHVHIYTSIAVSCPKLYHELRADALYIIF